MKKTSSILLSLILSLFPLVSLTAQAQEEVAAETAAAPAPATSGAEPEAPAPATDASGGIQETLPSENLENTDNPQETALQEAIQFIDAVTEGIMTESTSTEGAIIEVEAATSTDKAIEVILPAEEEVAALEEEVLVPQKEFTFEITGEAIAAKENPEWTEEGRAEGEAEAGKVTQAASLSIEAESRALEIRGSCSDAYYVVLVYRNQGDYDANPASYIYNKAYPCVAGSYAYELAQLPFNLETGRFYLLIAGQGNEGPWKPITALMPVGITVTTTYVPAGTSTEETQ